MGVRERTIYLAGSAMILAGAGILAWSGWAYCRERRATSVVPSALSPRDSVIQSSKADSRELLNPPAPKRPSPKAQWTPSLTRLRPAATLASAAQSSIRVTTDFEGAYPMAIDQVGVDQYRINLAGRAVNWWGMKVQGAGGHTLKFTFTGVPAEKWSAMRPLLAYGSDLSDVSLYEPDEHGQSRWQYIPDLNVNDVKTVSFAQKFEKDAAFVVLRIPYTPRYQNNYIATLPKLDGMEVIEIGRSAKGNPLTLIKIGRGDMESDKENPCVLVYAREHCDEPDSSWAAQGALRFLTADTPEARQSRQHFTFLLIPILDPDGAANGIHEGIIRSFSGYSSMESQLYGRALRSLVNRGMRLDMAIDLHNPEPDPYPNLLSPYMDEADPTRQYNELLHSEMSRRLGAAGFSIEKWDKHSSSPGRLMQWAHDSFGALPIIYEVNSQAPGNRLSLDKTRNLGAQLLQASCSFLSAENGSKLMAESDAVRASRLQAMSSLNGRELTDALPFLAEEKLKGIRSKSTGHQ